MNIIHAGHPVGDYGIFFIQDCTRYLKLLIRDNVRRIFVHGVSSTIVESAIGTRVKLHIPNLPSIFLDVTHCDCAAFCSRKET